MEDIHDERIINYLKDSHEVIIASSSACEIYESTTGNLMFTFKDTGLKNIGPKSLCMLKEEYFVAASENIPVMAIWMIPKSESSKFYAPAKNISILISSSSGLYCAAASENNIYLWKVTNGEMLCLLSRHTQNVSCLRFSKDDSHLISGGFDSLVFVWLFSDLVSRSKTSEIQPRFTWNNHTAAVTDVFVGSFGFYAKVATVSLDMTCKIYELDTGLLLTTVCTGQSLTAVCMDPLEYFATVGTNTGCLYKVNLYEKPQSEIDFGEDRKNSIKAHNSEITILSVSEETSYVLSASKDNDIKIWDLFSMCCIQTITLNSPVKNAFYSYVKNILCYPSLKPSFRVMTFKRYMCLEEEGLDKPTKFYEDINPNQGFKPELTFVGTMKDPHHFDLIPKLNETSNVAGSVKNEDLFQTALNARSINALHAINSQLYSYALNIGMGKISDEN